MTTCPICDYHYSHLRFNCPTCGTVSAGRDNIVFHPENSGSSYGEARIVVLAQGFERAWQNPRSLQVSQE